MKLNLTVENMSLISLWVDDSCNVQCYSREHNEAMMSIVKGGTNINYNKKNINVNSSSEG